MSTRDKIGKVRVRRSPGRMPQPAEAPVRQSEGAVMALALPQGELDGAMRAYFEKCHENIGFVPNVLRAYAHDNGRLSAFAAFYQDVMLAPSGLSRLEREMIAVAVSAQNHCHYGLVAHGAALRQLSGDFVLGEMMVTNWRVAELSQRHRTMLAFAMLVTDTPGTITQEHRDALQEAGFGERDIWDIAAVAAFFNMFNRLAAAVEIRPNAEYHQVGR